jgi:hypothetical protein
VLPKNRSRSDARSRPVWWAEPCRNRPHIRHAASWPVRPENDRHSVADRRHDLGLHEAGARHHDRHRHERRERPRGRRGAAFARRRRGRSRPFLAATPVLGRLPGGTNRRPPDWAQPATTSAPSVDCGASMTAVALESRASREIAATTGGGPTAPWPCVPLLGPPVGVGTAIGGDDGRVSASP